MKILLHRFKFLLFSLIIGNGVFAQTSGVVEYQVKTNQHKGMTDDRFKEFIPEFDSTIMVLFFNEEECYYEKKPKEVVNLEDEKTRFFFGGSSDNQFYQNITTSEEIEQTDFLGKRFLIIDTIQPIKWKLTSETKTIHGYPCIKATLEEEKGLTEAWFAPSIPANFGPELYTQLPGLILEMSVKDELVVITMLNYDKRELKSQELKRPRSGKKVSREEFKRIEKEKMKEQEELKKLRGR